MRAGSRKQFACILGIFVLVGLPAALSMASYQAASLDEAGDIFGDSEFVVLEPEQWIGKQFPLLKYIDIGHQLAGAEWIVVLYRSDCPSCQQSVRKYQQLARASMTRSDAPRIALVEIPPYANHADAFVSPDLPWTRGRLSLAKQWFVTPPVQLTLERGVVVAIDHAG